jgi:hypothetical protein
VLKSPPEGPIQVAVFITYLPIRSPQHHSNAA